MTRCPKCGGVVKREPQVDGPDEYHCVTCGLEVLTDLDRQRTRDYLARRGAGGERRPGPWERAPSRDRRVG